MAKKNVNKNKPEGNGRTHREINGGTTISERKVSKDNDASPKTRPDNNASPRTRPDNNASPRIRLHNGDSTKSHSGSKILSYVVWITLAVAVALGSVIFMNEGMQMYIVQLTGAGSNPLQYVDSIPPDTHVTESHGPESTDENQYVDSILPDTHVTESRGPESTDENQYVDSILPDTHVTESRGPESTAQSPANEQETRSPDDSPLLTDTYVLRNITSDKELAFKTNLDSADAYREKKELQKAMDRYDNILRKHGNCPRAMWGKALVLLAMAEQQRSNALLEEGINLLNSALKLADTPPALMTLIGPKLADSATFRGWQKMAIDTWKFLCDRFPDSLLYQQSLGTSYLTKGDSKHGREVFQKILKNHPEDGFSLVHLAFIEKTENHNYVKSIELFSRGLAMDGDGVHQGKFYHHYGDAYIRLQQPDKAREVFVDAKRRGLFLSEDQRSLYNADRPLTARPVWTAEQTGYQRSIQLLEKNWAVIRDEALSLFDAKTQLFVDPTENLVENEKDGDWKQYTFATKGRLLDGPCKKAPRTCDLVRQIEPAMTCKRGQIKFSVMQGGIHVWAHTGPTNCRLRAHLGLVVPQGPELRVVNETLKWQEGKVLIFDDSFEHEVWHHGTDPRIILIIDFWHPDLTKEERLSLSPI